MNQISETYSKNCSQGDGNAVRREKQANIFKSMLNNPDSFYNRHVKSCVEKIKTSWNDFGQRFELAYSVYRLTASAQKYRKTFNELNGILERIDKSGVNLVDSGLLENNQDDWFFNNIVKSRNQFSPASQNNNVPVNNTPSVNAVPVEVSLQDKQSSGLGQVIQTQDDVVEAVKSEKHELNENESKSLKSKVKPVLKNESKNNSGTSVRHNGAYNKMQQSLHDNEMDMFFVNSSKLLIDICNTANATNGKCSPEKINTFVEQFRNYVTKLYDACSKTGPNSTDSVSVPKASDDAKYAINESGNHKVGYNSSEQYDDDKRRKGNDKGHNGNECIPDIC